MILALSIIMAALFVMLSVSLYFNVKHGLIIIRVQDQIEDSLDILDSKYASISDILERPVFFDSLEVRQVINDISSSRDAILFIAKSLSAIEEKEQGMIDEQE
jgi:hypothetical protein